MFRKIVLLVCIISLFAVPPYAWIYPARCDEPQHAPADPPKKPQRDLFAPLGEATPVHRLRSREAKIRTDYLSKYGGNDASEAAVASALNWLVAHQLEDGGWNFDHTAGTCSKRCSHPGNIPEARNAATAMGLLPLLGAGETHQTGEHKRNVNGGLVFLVSRVKPAAGGSGSFHEPGGSMYSHALATLALTEAYSMTNDKALLVPTQACIDYIAYAQDPVGGGWRYTARTAGDTSVSGWQLAALTTAHPADLTVDPEVFERATTFFDSVQANDGATYGYTRPGTGSATSAIGLLSRIELGWNKENPALKRGVEFLSTQGPSNSNMYYNFYATQVMKEYGGELWRKWNTKLRDLLLDKQEKHGHAKGSWDFPGGMEDRGGRLCTTSLATMILQVYYRKAPRYE